MPGLLLESGKILGRCDIVIHRKPLHANFTLTLTLTLTPALVIGDHEHHTRDQGVFILFSGMCVFCT